MDQLRLSWGLADLLWGKSERGVPIASNILIIPSLFSPAFFPKQEDGACPP